MVEFALLLLIGLFLLGFVQIPGISIYNYHLFTFNHHNITLFEVLTVIVVFALLGFIPKLLRIVIGALLIIWILSTLDIIMVKGLPVITIVVLMVVLSFHRSFHWYHRYRRRRYDY
jgi:hypothetical protein